eukprot:CAMPEP_0202896134 /NCGR_PEP_ID=MMETSP1392-20130828/5184_1 /ASSEMBLY_ACC=CAM_ASM_000868 /TAXON_ID=225041 /ORGANISM="Chlamydomonas chlamydogama, Strain SAG 11-48b" /LENGTH=119 /DNA_ID=CAMNT_0049581373 /DNA_START=1191 /DNA_END=1550 /DNA_ORIENTATION=+
MFGPKDHVCLIHAPVPVIVSVVTEGRGKALLDHSQALGQCDKHGVWGGPVVLEVCSAFPIGVAILVPGKSLATSSSNDPTPSRVASLGLVVVTCWYWACRRANLLALMVPMGLPLGLKT